MHLWGLKYICIWKHGNNERGKKGKKEEGN